MKHRVLLEFSADTLPDDFLDQIAGRVYGHPAVDKKECTASFVGDVLKDTERLDYLQKEHATVQLLLSGSGFSFCVNGKVVNHVNDDLRSAIDAAKDTQ